MELKLTSQTILFNLRQLLLFSVIFFITGLVECQSDIENEMYVTLKQKEVANILKMNINLNKTGDFTYDPNIFNDNFQSRRFKHDDSLIHSQPSIAKISDALKSSRIVSENRRGQRKIILIPYLLINGERFVSPPDNFFDTLIHVHKKAYPEFTIKANFYNINEVKINKTDKEIRFIYLFDKKSIGKCKAFYSNWIFIK